MQVAGNETFGVECGFVCFVGSCVLYNFAPVRILFTFT